MAGNYADVPGHRMALDLDGSFVGYISAGIVIELANPDIVKLCNETGDAVQTTDDVGQLVIIFPELRDLTGFFIGANDANYGNASATVYTSPDSTNGIDGTWTLLKAAYPVGNTAVGGTHNIPAPVYRTAIEPDTATGVKVMKIVATGGWHIYFSSIHLYGNITAGENPDRLAIWDPSSDAPVGPAYFDWGNAPRSSSANKTFRIKNLSSTLTANTITVSTDALTDTTPITNVSQHTLSNGGAFASTADGGNLAPGAISGVLTLRRTTDVAATLSLWALRLKAIAASWS